MELQVFNRVIIYGKGEPLRSYILSIADYQIITQELMKYNLIELGRLTNALNAGLREAISYIQQPECSDRTKIKYIYYIYR